MIANEWYTTDDEKRQNQNVFAYAVSFGLARKKREEQNKMSGGEEEKMRSDETCNIFYGSWCVLRGVVAVEIALWQCQLKPKKPARWLVAKNVDRECDSVPCAQGMSPGDAEKRTLCGDRACVSVALRHVKLSTSNVNN